MLVTIRTPCIGYWAAYPGSSTRRLTVVTRIQWTNKLVCEAHV